MNYWECQRHRCPAVAWGVGGVTGLKAIGWYVKLNPGKLALLAGTGVAAPMGPTVFCPTHRPDGIPCDQLSQSEWTEQKIDGNWETCAPCRADLQAKVLQDMIEKHYDEEQLKKELGES